MIGALVRLDGVSRTFGSGPGAVVAVHDATGEVGAGERLAVVGSSGSGKSTLIHLLAGLDQPTRGTVTWPGIEGALRPGPVSVVFQGPSLLSALDVTENVAFPLLLAGSDEAGATDRARRALARLELAFLADKLPDELSGGQLQRVAVARTLAGRPALVLADEPTGQLDHLAGAAVIDAILETADELGAGLVVTTHDQAVADRFDRRWTMRDGELRA